MNFILFIHFFDLFATSNFEWEQTIEINYQNKGVVVLSMDPNFTTILNLKNLVAIATIQVISLQVTIYLSL